MRQAATAVQPLRQVRRPGQVPGPGTDPPSSSSQVDVLTKSISNTVKRLNAKCVYNYTIAPPNIAIVEPSALASFLRGDSEENGVARPAPAVAVAPAPANAPATPADSVDGAPPDGAPVDPSQIAALLAVRNIDYRVSVRRYFDTIHSWFRIVREDDVASTFSVSLGGHPHQPRVQRGGRPFHLETAAPEPALLLLCICLLVKDTSSRKVNNQIFCPLYRTARRMLSTLMCLAEPSVTLMQCGAMMTLYEFGHGDSASAYRSLSETVAMARVAGCRTGKFVGEDVIAGDVYDEDKRALWWGLYLLDQSVAAPYLFFFPYPCQWC